MMTATLTTSGTTYQLSALISGIDTDFGRLVGPLRCQQLSIQIDKGAGAANVQVGNSDVSSSFYGVNLVATQTWSFPSLDANLIRLDNIWILADTDAVKIHICFITR